MFHAPYTEITPATQAVPVYVISLARAPERRASIMRHLEKLGIVAELIDAVDGSLLTPEDISGLVATGISLHPGTIGCYLSHLRAYERVRAGTHRVALVLEDDARLNPRVASLLREGLKESDFDYCFLDCDDHNDRGPVFYDAGAPSKLGHGFVAYDLSAGPQTLHAYLISRDAATNRLRYALPIAKAIDLYDHLPYAIHFRAVVSPKGAWVSEHSLESFTSKKNTSIRSLPFAALRRWRAFYALRDLVRLKPFRRDRIVRKLLNSGQLAAGRRWRALPSGREILVD